MVNSKIQILVFRHNRQPIEKHQNQIDSFVQCPLFLRRKKYQYPPAVEVDVVWVKEKACSVPAGEEPIDWKLITTHRIAEDDKAIKQVIQWYTDRWLIEEFFLSQKQALTIWKMPCWRQVTVCEN